jgi:hypothetical protein
LRTRVLLTLAMAGIIAGTTLVSVLAIRQPLQALFVSKCFVGPREFHRDLWEISGGAAGGARSRKCSAGRFASLKALMTTNDERTIEDGAVEVLEGEWNRSVRAR